MFKGEDGRLKAVLSAGYRFVGGILWEGLVDRVNQLFVITI